MCEPGMLRVRARRAPPHVVVSSGQPDKSICVQQCADRCAVAVPCAVGSTGGSVMRVKGAGLGGHWRPMPGAPCGVAAASLPAGRPQHCPGMPWCHVPQLEPFTATVWGAEHDGLPALLIMFPL